MNNAMQDMLLNMILPKDQQEQMKKLLTPENIKAVIEFAKTDYKALKDQLNRIEAKLDDNGIEAKLDDNGSGRGTIKLIAGGDANGSDRSTGTAG